MNIDTFKPIILQSTTQRMLQKNDIDHNDTIIHQYEIPQIANFEKISFDQFKKDMINNTYYKIIKHCIKINMISNNLDPYKDLNNNILSKLDKSDVLKNALHNKDFIMSIDPFYKDHNANDVIIKYMYDNITIPKRATSGSAGYDFYNPFGFDIEFDCYNTEFMIPTGIRARICEGWMMQAHIRSGLGTKNKIRIANTVGIIDSDYYFSNNEGHIFVKFSTDLVKSYKDITKIKSNDAMFQGIFIPYGVVVNDNVSTVRDGGFGSTSK